MPVSERRFVIRPSMMDDRGAVADLVRTRAAWLGERGLNRQRWEMDADAIAAQSGDPAWTVWVLVDGDRIVGRTAWNTDSPPFLFTDEERAVPGLFMHGTVTDPRARGTGLLILFWAVDHAHRAGYAWVRRGAAEPGLRRYYCEVQGWRVVRAVPRQGKTVWAMSRPAEPQPGIDEYVIEQAPVPLLHGA